MDIKHTTVSPQINDKEVYFCKIEARAGLATSTDYRPYTKAQHFRAENWAKRQFSKTIKQIDELIILPAAQLGRRANA